jgi:splicing factor 3A subunit 3
LHADTLEDNERLVAAIVRDYHKEVKSHKDKLLQDHRVKKALDDLQSQSRRLVNPMPLAFKYF